MLPVAKVSSDMPELLGHLEDRSAGRLSASRRNSSGKLDGRPIRFHPRSVVHQIGARPRPDWTRIVKGGSKSVIGGSQVAAARRLL